MRFENGEVRLGDRRMPFTELVASAYTARVQLWSDGYYATPGLTWDAATLQGTPFHYYACGAAVSEVVVDTLTGEWRLLRADLLHEAGASLNPAIDSGQIEGGYIQGMGWLTTEQLVWHPETGRLLTHAPSTYKIPTANDCPAEFNVALYGAPCGVDTIHRSKAVGEPPLLLAFSVWFAIRDAIAAACGPGRDPPLSAPATPGGDPTGADGSTVALRLRFRQLTWAAAPRPERHPHDSAVLAACGPQRAPHRSIQPRPCRVPASGTYSQPTWPA